MEDLDNLLESIDDRPLTDEEKEILKKQALDSFNELEGVEFDDISEDELINIKNDFKTTRNILTKNIDRVEKLTNLLITNVASQPENIIMLQNLIGVISEQNKQIKMIHEIHNKTLINTQASKKNNTETDKPGKGNKYPSNMKLK